MGEREGQLVCELDWEVDTLGNRSVQGHETMLLKNKPLYIEQGRLGLARAGATFSNAL